MQYPLQQNVFVAENISINVNNEKDILYIVIFSILTFTIGDIKMRT